MAKRTLKRALEFHGMSKTTEYVTWAGMKRRCSSPSEDHWEYYGGRGVKVYGPWEKSFTEFYNYIGPKPPGHSIDRIDNDGHYEPGNVRWATMEQQISNRSEYGKSVKVTTPLKEPPNDQFNYRISRNLSRWRNLHSRVEVRGVLSDGRVFVLFLKCNSYHRKKTKSMVGEIGEVVRDCGGAGGRWLVDFKPLKLWLHPEDLMILSCVRDLHGPTE